MSVAREALASILGVDNDLDMSYDFADPRRLLLRCRASVRCSLLCLYLCLCDDVGLMDGSLDDLLFFWVQVFREVFVECGLLLLEACWRLVNVEARDLPPNLRSNACLNMPYGSTLSSGVSSRLSSSSSSSSSSSTEENFWACGSLATVVPSAYTSYLFVQEFKVCSAFVLDVFCFICFVVPVRFLFPFLILFVIVPFGEVEVGFTLSFLAVYSSISVQVR